MWDKFFARLKSINFKTFSYWYASDGLFSYSKEYVLGAKSTFSYIEGTTNETMPNTPQLRVGTDNDFSRTIFLCIREILVPY